MKKTFVSFMLLALSTMAYSQVYKMNLHFKSGTVVDFYMDDLDSMECVVEEHVNYDTKQAVSLYSGVKWATCNIGAKSPHEYGDYFAWGETKPKKKYGTDTYMWCKWCKDCSTKTNYWYTKYNCYSDYGIVDSIMVLEPQDDAATANWGEPWRMPTNKELQQLIDSCYWELTSDYAGTGISGYIVYKAKNYADKGKIKHKNSSPTTAADYLISDTHIFLPNAGGCSGYGTGSTIGKYGWYWTSTFYIMGSPKRPDWAHMLYLRDTNVYDASEYRYEGITVRPVCQ